MMQDSHAPGRTAKNENLSSNAQCPMPYAQLSRQMSIKSDLVSFA
ncbi:MULTISPECIES: hypothetical protein [unclassified Fischerella]|nr:MULTISPECIES: hypothetical protein [unclassified Fischerella]